MSYLKFETMNASRATTPRQSAIHWPSGDSANREITRSEKFVTFCGGPPDSGCRQMFIRFGARVEQRLTVIRPLDRPGAGREIDVAEVLDHIARDVDDGEHHRRALVAPVAPRDHRAIG
jgi:hypothetical protein